MASLTPRSPQCPPKELIVVAPAPRCGSAQHKHTRPSPRLHAIPRDLHAAVASSAVWLWWLWPPEPRCSGDIIAGSLVATTPRTWQRHRCRGDSGVTSVTMGGQDRDTPPPAGVTSAIAVVAQRTGLVACVPHHVPKCQRWSLGCLWCPQEGRGHTVAGDTIPHPTPQEAERTLGSQKGFLGTHTHMPQR